VTRIYNLLGFAFWTGDAVVFKVFVDLGFRVGFLVVLSEPFGVVLAGYTLVLFLPLEILSGLV
jgi:hypothetical protein